MYIAVINKIMYKGYELIYYKTNKGALFSLPKLFNLRYPYYSYSTKAAESKVSSHLVMNLPLWRHSVRCVGLKGVRQLFADKPDPELEKCLISQNIIQGDLPHRDDIRVFVHEMHEKCDPASDYVSDIIDAFFPPEYLFDPPCINNIDWKTIMPYCNGYQFRVAHASVKGAFLCYINLREFDGFIRNIFKHELPPNAIYEMKGLIEIPDDSLNSSLYDRLYIPYYEMKHSRFKSFRLINTVYNFEEEIMLTGEKVDIKTLNSNVKQETENQNTLLKRVQQLEKENKKLRQELQIQKRLWYN